MKSISRKSMFYWQADRPFTEEQVYEIFLERHQKYNKEELISAIEVGIVKAGLFQSPKVKILHQPIKRGSVNIVSIFELENGFKGVIRAHPQNIKNQYFFVESVATKYARWMGVPTYEMLFVGKMGIDADFDYMLTNYIEGEIVVEYKDVHSEDYLDLIRQLGHNMALIHKVETDGFGFFDNRIAEKDSKLMGFHEDFRGHFYAALDSDIKYHKQNEYIGSKDLDLSLEVFEKYKDLLDCKNAVLIDNDVADWNSLCIGNKISGIMDWDECFGGDPVCDFAQMSGFYPLPEQLKALKEGYCEIGELPYNFDDKYRLFKLRYLISKIKLTAKKLKFKANPTGQARLELRLQQFPELLKSFK